MAGRCEGEHPASPWRSGAPGEEGYSGSSPSAIILVGLIGATATAAAVGQLRRTVRWFYTQLRRSEPYVYWEDIPQTRRTYRHGEAWEQFYQRMRKMNEDQREREERIRRMQDVFKKERSKCRDYRTWESYNPYYQHDRRYDRYWDAESFYANQRTNFRLTPKETMSYAMSRHYSILGLDRSRSEPFSDA